MKKDCLYIGSVFHKRFEPKIHELRYRVFTLFADLDHLEFIAKNNRLFSLNSFNLVSFHESDYGDPKTSKSSGLKERLLDLLNTNGVDATKVKSIQVLTYPRILGFVFNPLTVFYCYGENNKHMALIYEVRNTFSERHNYIFTVPENGSFNDLHSAKKCFHVSPFFDQQGHYEFSIVAPDKKTAVTIGYIHAGRTRLVACFSGKQQEISDKALFALSLKMPFMTLKVMGGIIFEAIKLKLKGLYIYSHVDKHAYQSSEALAITKKQKSLQKGTPYEKY
jgi:DUF1365 family protein